MNCKKAHFRAFSIIEAVLSVAIVGVLCVSSVAVFGTIGRTRFSQSESRLGTLLAQQLMTEIMQEPFQQAGPTPGFGPRSGQTRATFDAVDCYDGYTAGPPASGAGTALTDYAGWTQASKVVFVAPASPDTATAATTTLKRITVTLTSPMGRSYALVGWRSKFGPYEATPSAVTTYVTGVTVSVQSAMPTKSVQTGAHPLNVITSQ